MPPLTYTLIDWIGWRATYLWTGGVLAVLLTFLAWLVIRNRPEDLGLNPDGAAVPIPEATAAELALGRSRGTIWKTRRFWELALPLAATPFVSTATMFHQVSLFQSRGLTAQNSAVALTVLACAGAVGQIAARRQIDRGKE